MRKYLLCFLSFALLGFSAPPNPESINSFGSDFYQKLDNDNICFSPYSLFNCLSTLYLGAKNDTEQEMAKALHIENIGQKNLPKFLSAFHRKLLSDQFHFADAIWLKEGSSLLEEYKKTIKYLNLEVSNLDFSDPISSSSIINKWVLEKTKNTIDHLISPSDISKTTEIILTNALHFQSNWVKPFSKNLTTLAPFYINEEESSLVQMMNQTSYFPYYEDDNCQLILLQTQSKDSSYACFFLLPKTCCNDIEKNFSLKLLLEQIYQTQNTLTQVFIPKFTLQNKLNVKNVLKDLGIKKAFSKGADFSSLTGTKNLSVDKVLHEVFFSIEETGVTASAATAITLMTSCAAEKKNPVSFVANRPFLFGIVDLNSDLVLFLGKLTRP